jgi:hypothetical protein
MKHLKKMNEQQAQTDADIYGIKFIRDTSAPSIEESKHFQDLVQKYDLKNITTPLQRKRNVVRFLSPSTSRYSDARSYVLYPNGVIRTEILSSSTALKDSNYKINSQGVIDRLGIIKNDEDIKRMIDRIELTIIRSRKIDSTEEERDIKRNYLFNNGNQIDEKEWKKIKNVILSKSLNDLNKKIGLFN